MDEEFDLDEIVWAKINGFPWWPSFISSKNDSGLYEVVFLCDLSRSFLRKEKIRHFNEISTKNHVKSKALKKSIQMCKAILNMEMTLIEVIDKCSPKKFSKKLKMKKPSKPQPEI